MRQLSGTFQEVLKDRRRHPAYKIYAWNPAEVTISEIVSATSCLDPSIPMPMDLTPYTSDVDWSDKQFSFTLVDPRGLFHPDTGAYRNYLGDTAILRLVEGDDTIPESDWIITGTGQVHGQIGWKMARHSGEITAKVTAQGRADTQAYKRRKITSNEYSVGTDLGVALYDICLVFMGLTAKEMRIPFVLGRQFMHKTNQLSQVTPWDGISSLLEVVCFVPYFDGEGKLTAVNKNLQRPPDKILEDYIRCVEMEVPEHDADGINKIRVTFLASELSRVDGTNQKLGTAQITTGFFSSGETLHCWWSADRTQRAYLTGMKILKPIGCGVPFIDVGTESYSQVDEYHGDIKVHTSAWVPILAMILMVIYLVCAIIPDFWVGMFFGVTIPFGRVIQAICMIGILVLMMSIGSGQYEIWGVPFDFAYLEKTSIAMEDGLDYWMENEREIKNDFIGDHNQADIIALTELIWEKAQSKPRRIIIEDDPSLEVGDIVIVPDGRKMLINGLTKKIKRGEVLDLTIDCSKVMTA
jgi:hypothetical protein